MKLTWWIDDHWGKIEKVIIVVAGLCVLTLIGYSIWYMLFSGKYEPGPCEYEYDGIECIN